MTTDEHSIDPLPGHNPSPHNGMLSPGVGSKPDLPAIRQRLDWLFRYAQTTEAMRMLRQVVQQYREADRP